jgi:hypothetical protein
MQRLWSMIKKEDSLQLGEDFYSLAFYGFYLEDDEEELSIHSDVNMVKKLISKQAYKSTRVFDPRMSMTSELNDPDLDSSSYFVESDDNQDIDAAPVNFNLA